MRNHPKRKDCLPVIYTPQGTTRVFYKLSPYEARAQLRIVQLEGEVESLRARLSEAMLNWERYYKEARTYEPSYRREASAQQNAAMQQAYNNPQNGLAQFGVPYASALSGGFI